VKIQLIGDYSEELAREIQLTAISCRELSGLGRRPYTVKIKISKRLISKPFSVKESNNGIRTFHVTLSDRISTLAIEELMPKIFSSIVRRVLGTSRNFNIRVRDSYSKSLVAFSRLLGT
jgi:hypothetical protein